MTDTSTIADRLAFMSLIENGQGDITSATRVANCLLRLPETSTALMGLPDGATFATAAARMAFRLAHGEPPLLG